MTPAIMLQGTGSDVGKSLLVAGLCRAYARRGLAVRPFKPQNMSNNAAVTEEGGEIGRAQALQARAAGVPPSVLMNPILLKPQSETGAQLVLLGEVQGTMSARRYQAEKPKLLPRVLQAYRRLAQAADLVLVEGAGSPAEVNLRAGDLANMGFAEAAGLPVLLIGDIDRGGVIASLAGTWLLLRESERARIKGFLVNKFRGDAALFADGMAAVTAHTGWPGLGLVPWFAEADRLPAEDSVVLQARRMNGPAPAQAPLRIAVPKLPHIANFDDLDPLRAEPDVSVTLVPPGAPLPADAHLLLLPGSKATLSDLRFLKRQGWDIDIAAHRRRGGAVLGVCAGLQMLGRRVSDPDGVEGAPGCEPGLGLLELETVLTGAKALRRAEGVHLASGTAVQGYEMHMGRSRGAALARPFLRLGDTEDGAVSPDGRVMGGYLHGLFAADGFRHAFLRGLRARPDSGLRYEAEIDAVLDRLAAHLAAAIDLDRLWEVARAGA